MGLGNVPDQQTAALLAECDATVLAQWRRDGLDYAADVVEAYQAEVERLQAKLAGLESVLRVAKAGRNSRPDETLTRDEAWARKGQDDVIEVVEEALRVF